MPLLQEQDDVELTLFGRNASKLPYENVTKILGNASNLSELENALKGQDIVYMIFDNKAVTDVVVEAMGKTGVKRIIQAGVKEQVAGLFAQKLAEHGYITITADAAFQGQSGGEPRMVDRPEYRVEDIHAMADAISLFPGVDDDRIGAFGVCGGGYTLRTGQTDKRFKTVATLSAFNSGLVRRNGFVDSQIDSIQERLAAASEARNKRIRGEGVD